jgi:U3 small nucleolar RNA-associated protein 21
MNVFAHSFGRDLINICLISDVKSEESDDDVDQEEFSAFKSPEQISNDLVTLSLLPNSRWQNLLNLDVIKVRPRTNSIVVIQT